MSFKHLLLRIKELSHRKASCRLSLPRRQIHSKWPVIFTHWLNNPFENLLRDSDTLLRLLLFFFLGPFEQFPLYTHFNMKETCLNNTENGNECTYADILNQCMATLCSAGKFSNSDGFMFSDVLVESEARSWSKRPESHMDDLPQVVSPHLILFSTFA